jgi:hypothetical protein
MNLQLTLSIARIRSSDNNKVVVGVGFQIDKSYVLTCAHVITQASGAAKDSVSPQQIEISLDYPFVNPDYLLRAHIILWNQERDIAVLELLNVLQDTQTASMVPAEDLWGHSFRAFGFPTAFGDGVWATGVLRDGIANGWIQIEDIKDPGHRIEPGFSGSPVWDEKLEAVVGMVVAAETQQQTKAAYIIPVYLLLNILSRFKIECDLTGSWDTNWGEMKLQQVDKDIIGKYAADNGLIKGNLEGNKLKGTWSEISEKTGERDKVGDFEFFISHDCTIFRGNWRYGSSGKWEGDWSGSLTRKGIDSNEISELDNIIQQSEPKRNPSIIHGEPIHRRKFHALLCCYNADKKIVDNIDSWLHEIAGIPLLYDGRNLLSNIIIDSQLEDAIIQCRAMIIILSKSTISSGWVKKQLDIAREQHNNFRDFRIIPLLIEACDIPDNLYITKWINLIDGRINIESAYELLKGLYYYDAPMELGKTRDIYVSRSWRESENDLADFICNKLVNFGFRLIGDSKDQAGFEEGGRVKSLISSCCGLVAILPDRGQEKTSPYMLDEIEIAKSLGLPCLIVVESTVKLPDDLSSYSLQIKNEDIGNRDYEYKLLNKIEDFGDKCINPLKPHFIFFGADFEDQYQRRNQLIKNIVEYTAASPCIMGDNVRESQIQQSITNYISNSLLMIVDISRDNLNTCIEAGIARGAKVKLYLLAHEPRRSPPFMLQDLQVWYYSDDLDFLGKVHQIVHPYRRRVINFEL